MSATQHVTVEVPTPEGVMATEIFGLTPGAPQPGVIMYMDARGVRDELREMCARLSTPGYAVFLPDLYHRFGRQIGFPSETSKGTPEEAENILRHIHGTTNAHAIADTAALLTWIDANLAPRPTSLGVVGYCMGGPFVFAVAGRFADRIAAGASFYGVGCMTDRPDSPHLEAAKVRGELYFGYAEKDHLAPVEEVGPLDRMLSEAGVRHAVEIYPDVDHGFAFPRRAVYDEAATGRHWQALFDLYGRNLT